MIAMVGKEKTLSKEIIDEYIQLNFKANFDIRKKKSYFDILKRPELTITGRREFAGSNVSSDKLQYLLSKIKSKIELSFSEKLMELIKEKGKKPADIYKKAEVDKSLFSKIKSDKDYHPTKGTALAFAIALHLTLEETQDLIGRAGYALSNSVERDLIVQCYIESKAYNVNDLNGKLIDYGYDPLTNK